MYSSDQKDYEKSPLATGIPVKTTYQYSNNSQPPPPPPPPPPAQYLRPTTQAPWSSGLCDCFSDCRNCCITFWCPCITFGQISEIIDKGSSSCAANGALYTLIACVTGCACFYSCFYRHKMRQQYGLKDSPCGDCLVHCCCEACALCQEYRELKHRGFNMSIGWQGNVEKQSRGIAMQPVPPVVEEGMTR